MKDIQTNKGYFSALTGVRAIAAFMVYFHHFNPINKNIFGQGVYDFFSELHIGVTLFFVLSGFLIAYRYYNLENINFKEYMINRFARIYPMYFLLTTITFLFFAILHAQYSFSDFKIYFLNITFLRGFFNDFKFTGVGQGWSLTVEEIFYIIAPLLFIVVKKSKLFLLALPILILMTGFLLVYIFQDYSFYGLMKTQDFMLDFTFFGRCIEFFIGISLAIFIKKFENLNFRVITYFGLFSICFFVFLLSILKVGDGYGTDCMFGKIINTLLLPLFGIAPLFIGLIFEKTLISKILESRLFQILGKSSYVFYLIHMGIFVAVLNKIGENYIFHFVSLNIIAIILYQCLELPVNNYLRTKFSSV
ncbi:Peptidoglycan/LPS O-acetylase OafA/YrhL, contains acyltransferase and SGNH-hydrolase domains [Flavobacterium swingsii]|uniref:Peptidoglycan/LPS O-acetylase OafA/YrhL, contains acyltransferase and SGNH-hydrolase domains n=1 Tax=Flavobacterium swingsii TaxID=498292 RepID=A0A1I0WJN3_9FLAO|nr:acyltransferase [Flavobacterium swingsii]SFA88597.1 Peptidoglycan/LPS O-acetylase OafA/YrhL, contains acyltransferase and SGNH-hydrolase domains [Flavobacterium swingsii]